MAAPPLAADLIGAGIALNVARAIRNKNRARHGLPQKLTVSRWACRNKKIAVPVALAGGAWVTIHWARYVIDEVLPES